LHRRTFVQTVAAGVPVVLAQACRRFGPNTTRISARPIPATSRLEPGAHPLGIGTARYRGALRDGTLFVPAQASTSAVPLAVMLHGGGGKALDFKGLFPIAEEYGVAILTLDARHNTWDGVDSPFGPDVRFIDQSLTHTFERVAIDPTRIALGGASDGGMYALTIGAINGDLFTHLIAVAPGYMQHPAPPVGKPRVFLGHGTRDTVYSVASSRVRLLPRLREAGYDVTYYEFDGPHFITLPAARAAFAWLVEGTPSR
jgi:phospholipase/carboxylesterase